MILPWKSYFILLNFILFAFLLLCDRRLLCACVFFCCCCCCCCLFVFAKNGKKEENEKKRKKRNLWTTSAAHEIHCQKWPQDLQETQKGLCSLMSKGWFMRETPHLVQWKCSS